MNQIQIKEGYTNPQVEEKIKSLQVDLAILSLTAKQDSAQNKPVHVEYWLSRVYNVVQAQGEAVYNYLHQMVQPVSAATRRTELLAASQKHIEHIRSEINYEEVKLHKVVKEIKECVINRIKKLLRTLVSVFLVCAGLADIYLTIDAFRGAGIPFIAALLFGIPAGLAVSLGAGLTAAKYQKTKKKDAKRLVLISTIIGALIFFVVLGFLRANLYHNIPDISVTAANEITAHSAVSINGWELAIISFVLFIAGFFFSTYTALTDEEVQTENRLAQLQQEQAAIEASIEAKEAEITAIEDAANKEASQCMERCEYAVAAKKRIINISKSALAEYAATNIALRTDGLTPHFLTEVPDIIFHN